MHQVNLIQNAKNTHQVLQKPLNVVTTNVDGHFIMVPNLYSYFFIKCKKTLDN